MVGELLQRLVPADVLTYRLNRPPAWVRNYAQDAMGREGSETIMELADLRWQARRPDQADAGSYAPSAPLEV